MSIDSGLARTVIDNLVRAQDSGYCQYQVGEGGQLERFRNSANRRRTATGKGVRHQHGEN